MNLTTIIEKKKEEFRKSFPYCWIEWKKPGNFSPIQSKNKMLEVERFLEKAIRESVEEALREVLYYDLDRKEDRRIRDLCKEFMK